MIYDVQAETDVAAVQCSQASVDLRGSSDFSQSGVSGLQWAPDGKMVGVYK